MDTPPRRTISRRTLVLGGAAALGALAVPAAMLWPEPEGRPPTTVPLTGQREAKARGWIEAKAFSHDSRILATSNIADPVDDPVGNVVQLWDVATGGNTATWDLGLKISSLAFDPTGETLAGAGFDGTRLWDVVTGDHAELDDATAYAVAFSPDGALIAAGTWRGVTMWDTATRTPLGAPLDFDANDVAFSPDGTLLAAHDRDGVAAWDVATGRQILTVHETGVRSARFLDSGLLAVHTSERHDLLKLWNPGTGEEVTPAVTLTGVESAALSPDGSLLAASAILDGAWGLQLRDVPRDRVLQVVHTRALDDLWFSPDGRVLAGLAQNYIGAARDDSVLLWDVAPG